MVDQELLLVAGKLGECWELVPSGLSCVSFLVGILVDLEGRRKSWMLVDLQALPHFLTIGCILMLEWQF